MSTVCSSTLLGGLVDLDMLDNQIASIKTLSVGIGLSVLEESEKELCRLYGPSRARNTKLLS